MRILIVSAVLLSAALLTAAVDRSGSPPGWDHVADKNKVLAIAPSGNNLSWKPTTLNARDIVPDLTCTADASASLNAAIAATAPTGNESKGVQLFMPKGCYRLSSPLRVSRQSIVYGDGGGGNMSSTILRPDKSVTGIIVNYPCPSSPTCTTSPDGGRAEFTVIRDLSIQYINQGTGVWAPTHAYQLGDAVTYKNNTNLWATFVCTTAGTSSATEPAFDTYAESTEGGTIADGGVTWTSRIATAIRPYGRTRIERVYVDSAPGNGVHIFGSVPNSNNNGWTVRDVRIIRSALNGLYVSGNDANAGLAESVDVSDSYRGWGFYDHSFLGNTYIANESASNYLGPYTDGNAPTTQDVYVGCYSEGDQPPAQLHRQSQIVGGAMLGGGVTGSVTILADSGIKSAEQFVFTWGLSGGNKKTTFVSPRADGVPFEWREDAAGGGSVGMRLGATSIFPGDHSWTLIADSADSSQVLDISGSDAVLAGGQAGHIGFPRGLWMQSPSSGRNMHFGSCIAKPESFNSESAFAYPRGSFFFNDDPIEQSGVGGSAGAGILGWQKVHSGVYSPSGDWFTVRTPYFGAANTIPITNSVASPHAIDFLDQAGVTFVNDGAPTKAGIRLPPVAGGPTSMRGVEFSFYVTAPTGMRILGYDSVRKIKWGAQADADWIESTTVGSFLRVKAIYDNASPATPYDFKVIDATGVWTDSNGLVINMASGPATAATGNLCSYTDGTGSRFSDSGVPSANVVLVSRTVTAGTGLTGGGTLTSDITIGLASTINQAEVFGSSIGVSGALSVTGTTTANGALMCNGGATFNGNVLVSNSSLSMNGSGAEVLTIQSSAATAQIQMVGGAGNQINFTTCDGSGCNNKIGLPYNAPSALFFLKDFGADKHLDLVTTTGAERVLVMSQAGANPATGYMGHNIRSCVTAPSGITLSNNVATNITSLTLGAGNWEISAVGGLDGSLTGTDFLVGISATSGSFSGTQKGLTSVESPTVSSAVADVTLTIPGVQFNPTGSTTYYLVEQTTIAAGTALGYGCISAWNR